MIIQKLKKWSFNFLPNWLLLYYRKRNYKKKNIPMRDKKFEGLTNKEIFSYIYKNKLWGSAISEKFYSGPGSHNTEVTKKYINAFQKYFYSKLNDLTVLDLGCGDFNIGSQLYNKAKNYIGIDVVPGLIERNKKLYNAKNLTFFCLDIVKDELPDGDCILLREVLQHLTNNEVVIILEKLYSYKYVIITESIPIGKFNANLDKIKGPESRSYLNSGLIIHEPPFNFRYQLKKELLKIKRPGIDYLITTLYIKN